MTSDEQAEQATESSAERAGVRASVGSAVQPARWRSVFASPLRAALVAVAATVVLVAGPCAVGAFVLGAVVGSHEAEHGDPGRGDRRGDDRYDRPGDERAPGFDERRDGKIPMAPPATVVPSATPPVVVPSTAASN
jgi:hypothetical protein